MKALNVTTLESVKVPKAATGGHTPIIAVTANGRYVPFCGACEWEAPLVGHNHDTAVNLAIRHAVFTAK